MKNYEKMGTLKTIASKIKVIKDNDNYSLIQTFINENYLQKYLAPFWHRWFMLSIHCTFDNFDYFNEKCATNWGNKEFHT